MVTFSIQTKYEIAVESTPVSDHHWEQSRSVQVGVSKCCVWLRIDLSAMS